MCQCPVPASLSSYKLASHGTSDCQCQSQCVAAAASHWPGSRSGQWTHHRHGQMQDKNDDIRFIQGEDDIGLGWGLKS